MNSAKWFSVGLILLSYVQAWRHDVITAVAALAAATVIYKLTQME